jgi:hypothetical protein
MKLNLALSLLAFLVAENVLAQEITVEALDSDQFRLSFSSASVIGVDAAQVLVLPTAVDLCNDAIPVFGRYRFSSSERIVDAGAVQRQSFTFEQDISCSSEISSADRGTDNSETLSSPQSVEAENLVRAKSIEYFEDIGNERYEEAYAVVSESHRSYSTPESWKIDKQSFRAEVGAPVSIRIARLTVYQNPPNAPEPGIYVAADFNNEHELAPIHCGYLMWYRGEDGEYRIVREETGHVTAESLTRIPSEQIPVIRERLRCVAL